MGLFDTIKYKEESFQTKDLECMMIHYEIREDGTLWEQLGHYEEVPLEERPDPEFPIMGSMRYVPTSWEPVEHHGMISAINETSKRGERVIFKFTDGLLVEVIGIDK